MRYIVLIAGFLAIALLVTTCAKPEYWVKGLTLPPGSTVVDRSEEHAPSSKGVDWGATIFYGSLCVQFDHPGGWPAVASHFNHVMLQAGYTTGTESAGQIELSPNAKIERGEVLLSFSKPGNKYTVAVFNNEQVSKLLESYAQDDFPTLGLQSTPPKAGYKLTVYWIEKK